MKKLPLQDFLPGIHGNTTIQHGATLHLSISPQNHQFKHAHLYAQSLRPLPWDIRGEQPHPRLFAGVRSPFRSEEHRLGRGPQAHASKETRRTSQPTENSSENVVCLRCSILRKEEKRRKPEKFRPNLRAVRWGPVGLGWAGCQPHSHIVAAPHLASELPGW